jgi:hypothetical protein
VVFVTTVIFSGDEYLVVLPGTFDLCEEEVKLFPLPTGADDVMFT